MLFSVLLSEKLGISDDMSTGYTYDDRPLRTDYCLYEYLTTYAMSTFKDHRGAYVCVLDQGILLIMGPGPQVVLRRPRGQIIANERNNVLMSKKSKKKEENREPPIPVKKEITPSTREIKKRIVFPGKSIQ
ncbi:hypothetical protein TNCV_3188051 [Trichonephila clavipes]|nr:hypothetical protein TNCV_3188051 [Trichonephila clavipes]